MVFFAALSLYFVLLLCLCLAFARKNTNLEDYFLASRNLTGFLVFLSVSASWLGASSTLVSTDEALQSGLSSFWVMGMPTVATVLVFALFLARPIRNLSFISLPDLVEKRYGRTVRHLASVLIVWYMILLAASQMVALGGFLKSFIGTSYLLSLLLGTAVVLAYSVSGGFRSVVITDGFQFFFLVSGLLVLFCVLSGAGSLANLGDAAAQAGKDQYFNLFFDFKKNLLIFISFTLAWIISPITWQRIQGARDLRSAKRGLFSSAVVLFFLYGVIILIGMMSLSSFSSLPSQVPLLSTLISSRGGSALGIFLFVAIVSAIMSTLDTAINTGALSLTRDVFQQVFHFGEGSHPVLWGRASTLAIGFLSFLVATRFQNILKTLGLASEILAEGMFIPGVAMLFLKRRLPRAGLFSLLLGSMFALTGFLTEVGILGLSWPQWPNSVPYGLVLSAGGFFFGAVLDLKNKIT